MSLSIYFGTDSRPWKLSEIQFVLETLNDKRSWNVPVKQSLTMINAPVVFYLSSTKRIQEIFAGTEFATSQLSVTDRRNKFQYKVYFNLENWTTIPETSGYVSLAMYRLYLINHEFGHVLGRGHDECQGANLPSPVMKQQTLGTGLCYACVWPALCGDMSVNK